MVTLQVSKETSGQNSVVILFEALICSLTLFLRNHFPDERKMKIENWIVEIQRFGIMGMACD